MRPLTTPTYSPFFALPDTIVFRNRKDFLRKAASMLPTIHTGMPPGDSSAPPPAFHQQQAADTKTIHSHNGVYAPERAALHDKIIHHFLSGGQHADLHEDLAHKGPNRFGIYTMGGAGSGKSYYAKKKFLKHPAFVSIDPDAIKEHLPEYDPKNAGHVHEESSDLAKRLHQETMAKGKSFVYDGTGENHESMIKKMQASKAHGYKVHVHFAKVPLETALQRNAQRTRSLPETRVREQHAKIDESFTHIRPHADKVRVIHNVSEPPRNPYSERRAELLRSKQSAYVQKGFTAMPANPLKRVYLKPGHYLLGRIVKGHIHVKDVVSDGISEHALLGEKPPARVLALDHLKAKYPHFRIADNPAPRAKR